MARTYIGKGYSEPHTGRICPGIGHSLCLGSGDSVNFGGKRGSLAGLTYLQLQTTRNIEYSRIYETRSAAEQRSSLTEAPMLIAYTDDLYMHDCDH